MISYFTCSARIVLLALLIFVSTSSMYAQKDSIKLAEQFLKVCEEYKYTPLQLSLTYKMSTNYFVPGDDTSSVEARFFTSSNKAYVHFGEVEEIIEDSLALLISTSLRRMILYKNAAVIRSQIKGMFELKSSKGNAKKLFDNFSVLSISDGSGKEIIRLTSRKLMYRTEMPEEILELRYDAEKNIPVAVTDVQRQLLPIGALEFDSLRALPSMKKWIIEADGQYFITKEKQVLYEYNRIEHAADIGIPVNVGERVFKTAGGTYIPTSAYQEYIVTEEN